jgi:hypothetical protein
MLKENFNIHDIPSTWLERTYDLQQIFNKQTDGASKQRSLEYAMDYFEIPMNLPAHDALNDAYFTALVAKSLNVPEGIRTYSTVNGDNLEESVIGDADAGDDGYVTIGEMLEDETVRRPLCPLCKAPLTEKDKLLHSKGQKYTFHFFCKKDGDMLLSLKLHKNFNETWRAKRTVRRADEAALAEYHDGLERANIRKKATRRRKSKPKRRAASEAAENT